MKKYIKSADHNGNRTDEQLIIDIFPLYRNGIYNRGGYGLDFSRFNAHTIDQCIEMVKNALEIPESERNVPICEWVQSEISYDNKQASRGEIENYIADSVLDYYTYMKNHFNDLGELRYLHLLVYGNESDVSI